ncbi:M23 family metallopeptidase, partial [Chitinophaga sp.]|uniref:M23 family metallopeptidase n=1 Tax=Chitinophaga sp. TaxID=1869181 RepID=UPI00262C6996
MKKYIPICFGAALFFTACSASKRGLFVKRTPHEAYAARITDAGLRESLLGGRWFAAAEKGLARPLGITLPYQETGYFSAEDPDAAGFSFAARRGEQLYITVQVKPAGSLLVFTDLWQPASDGGSPQHLASADTLRTLQYDVERDGRFILRLQPELLNNVEYTIQIVTRPSLAFPVPGKSNARIGSFWGAARDGGARSHEGVDIFAKRRTPVVAAADGHVTRTGENNLGGKVVFMRPAQRDISLYYAHLDSQLVQPGQRVSAGDTLGLIGNPGNARNTEPHLHFGIYTASGAVDPLPYIQQNRKAPAEISAPITPI